MIDSALLRPGRLDKLLFVPLPEPAGRASIIRTLIRKTPLGQDVDPASLAESDKCHGFSGADLAALVPNYPKLYQYVQRYVVCVQVAGY